MVCFGKQAFYGRPCIWEEVPSGAVLYLCEFMQICTNTNCILYIDVFWLRAECTLSKSGI